MKTAKVLLAALGSMFVAASAAQANVIAYEGFDMPSTLNIGGTAGSGQGSATWNGSTWQSGGGPFWNRSSVGVPYPNLATLPGAARIDTAGGGNNEAFRNFGSQPATGTYWVSTLFTITASNTSSSIGYSLFSGGSEKNFVGKPGGAAWEATSGGGSSGVTVASQPTVMILSRYDMASGKQFHWLSPNISAGQPSDASSWTGAAGASIFGGGFSFDRIRIGAFSATSGDKIDEIRIGTTFADVAPLVPEPTSLAALAAAAVLGRRRR